MKKFTMLLIALLLISGFTVGAEDLSRPAFLPDWKLKYEGSELSGCLQYFGYLNVDAEMVKDYIAAMEHDGFSFIGTDKGKALCREDCFIVIQESLYKQCELSVWRGSAFPGQMKSGELTALMNESALCTLDISPEGLFEGSGLQLFVCLSSALPGEAAAFHIGFCLAGEGAYLELDFDDIACADLDRDGVPELLTLDFAETSGICIILFDLYGVCDGAPYLRYMSGRFFDYGRCALAVDEGKMYLDYSRQYYDSQKRAVQYKPWQRFEISLEGEELVIHHNEGEEDWPFPLH